MVWYAERIASGYPSGARFYCYIQGTHAQTCSGCVVKGDSDNHSVGVFGGDLRRSQLCDGAGYRPTPALGLPYGYAYAAIPISFLFVTVYEIRNLIVDLTGKGNHAAIEKPEEDLTGGGEFHLDMKE